MMNKFLFTVDELIEAGCFTKEEFQNAYNETKNPEKEPWKVFKSLAKEKGVGSESFWLQADGYFNS